MSGEPVSTVRTTPSTSGSAQSTRRRHGLRNRVAAISAAALLAAALLAAGGASAVAPSAAAQGLPEPIQTSYDALPPDVQSIVGSVALSGPLSLAALYYFVWCPVVNGPWDPTPESCSF
ncbi:hypothetical protein ACTXOY_05585 [Corynebacterium variabile]|uniref:hypothetical protein n=1 Tax=Corynebacterium variabile TaxID=1727 RepID=UPI003FCEF927